MEEKHLRANSPKDKPKTQVINVLAYLLKLRSYHPRHTRSSGHFQKEVYCKPAYVHISLPNGFQDLHTKTHSHWTHFKSETRLTVDQSV